MKESKFFFEYSLYEKLNDFRKTVHVSRDGSSHGKSSTWVHNLPITLLPLLCRLVARRSLVCRAICRTALLIAWNRSQKLWRWCQSFLACSGPSTKKNKNNCHLKKVPRECLNLTLRLKVVIHFRRMFKQVNFTWHHEVLIAAHGLMCQAQVEWFRPYILLSLHLLLSLGYRLCFRESASPELERTLLPTATSQKISLAWVGFVSSMGIYATFCCRYYGNQPRAPSSVDKGEIMPFTPKFLASLYASIFNCTQHDTTSNSLSHNMRQHYVSWLADFQRSSWIFKWRLMELAVYTFHSCPSDGRDLYSKLIHELHMKTTSSKMYTLGV